MTDNNLFSIEHIELVGMILFPLGTGIGYLIWKVIRLTAMLAQYQLKIDLIWAWFSNHGHDITGYQPGDEFKKT